MQDHVLDGSIRIRGRGKASSQLGIYNDVGRRPFSPSTGQYDHWGRQQPIRRHLRSQMYSESEDEDDIRIHYAKKQANPEPKLTDEELIARTLRRFTTFKIETNPIDPVISTSLASVALPSATAEVSTKTVTKSDEAGHSALQAAHERSGRGADTGEPQRPSIQEVTDNGIPIAPGQAIGAILEEPAVMTGEDGPTHDSRSDAPKRHARFADEAVSSGIARNRYISGPVRDSDGYLRHEDTDDRTSKVRRKRREAERLLQEADDWNDAGRSDGERGIHRGSMPRRTLNSRSATVEDFDPEHEGSNWRGLTKAGHAVEDQILKTQWDAQSKSREARKRYEAEIP